MGRRCRLSVEVLDHGEVLEYIKKHDDWEDRYRAFRIVRHCKKMIHGSSVMARDGRRLCARVMKRLKGD